MQDHVRLNAALTQFVHTIVRDYDIGHMLYLLSDHVAGVLGIHGAGVSLADDVGHLQFVTATDDATARAEQAQASVGLGPCHEAYREHRQVLVEDLREVDRWGKFTPLAVEAGMVAVAGIPMAAGDQCIGALNLYDTRAHGWSDEDVAAAQLLADMATGYIIHARKLKETRQLADQLQHALDSRVVIEQAKGMIAARRRVDVNDAFGVLRSYARSHNQRLHDTAGAVVGGELEL